MPTNVGSFVRGVVEPLGELCKLDLNIGGSTVRSFEQVIIDFSLRDQSRLKIDLECSWGIW